MKAILHIDQKKLKENTERILKKCLQEDISVMGVTKGFSGNPDIADILVDSGVHYLADARIKNIKKYAHINVPKVLLRIPALSEIVDVIRYADISLNSELETLKKLSEEALRQKCIHQVIMMIDLGELREGIAPEDCMDFISQAITLEGIKIVGLGTTLTCVSGVIPDTHNLSVLETLAEDIESKFDLELNIITGGNSSSYYLVENNELPNKINNLRLGELILMGRETAYGKTIDYLNQDVFTLKAELVELKTKPSLPKGTIGMDAFGRKPIFKDKGLMVRGLLAIGLQDVDPANLIPLDPNIKLIGASSDYILVDLTHSSRPYIIGDYVDFNITYGGMMQLFSSEYILKKHV